MKKEILAIFILGILIFSVSNLFAKDNYYINLEVEIPTDQQDVLENTELWFTTKILVFNNEERRDIQLTYIVLDEKRREITKKTETVAIETQASFVGSVLIPEGTKESSYTLQIQVIDPSGELIFTEKDFNVIKETNFLEEIKKNLGFYITLITLIILGIIFLTLKNKIKEIFEKIKSKRKIEKIIKSKVKNNEVSKEELKSGKIKEKKIVPEDQVF
jgi:hypothetical protein